MWFRLIILVDYMFGFCFKKITFVGFESIVYELLVHLNERNLKNKNLYLKKIYNKENNSKIYLYWIMFVYT